MIPWVLAAVLALALLGVWLRATRAQRELREQVRTQAETLKAEGQIGRQLEQDLEVVRADLSRAQDVIERHQAWTRANR